MAQQEYIVRLPSGEGFKVTGPEGLTDEQVIAEVRKANPNFDRPAREAGAALPTGGRRLMTGLQGVFMGAADELAGAAAAQGQAGAYAGAGYARQPAPTVRPEQMYEPAREAFRGGVESFREERPGEAMATEVLGGVIGAPLSLGLGAPRLGATAMQKGYQFLKPIVGTSAISAVGETEAETPGDFAEDVARRTAINAAFGTGLGVAGKGLGMVGSQIAQRTPGIKEKYAIEPARERLAQLLIRDMEARVLRGDADPITIAEARLRKLGPDATIAATGRSTTGELGLLRNLPGSAEELAARETRRIQKQRGPSITRAAERFTGVTRSAEDELESLAERQQKAAGPLYEKLRTVAFPIDAELKNILDRSRLDLGAAQRSAIRRGEQKVDLRKLQEGDELSFASADQLKRSLWDKREAALRKGNKNEAADADQLRLLLVKKLDSLSPDYATARSTFAGFAELQNAVEQGRKAFGETSESLSKLTNKMTPSELEAFQVGAVDSLRLMAGGQAGQTRLLNMYKEPELQGKLRAIFGNDFRKFQKTILQQEELKRVERAGQGSQTGRLLAGAEDQAAATDAIDLAAAAQTGGASLATSAARKFSQLRMPEATRNQLARLLLLRGEQTRFLKDGTSVVETPAADELKNMRAYIERRRRQQALAGQLAGRTGAITAQE